MEIAISHEHGRVPVTIFQLKGELNSEEPLRSSAKEAFDSGTRDLLLDLSNVSYMTNSGLRALDYAYGLLNSNDEQEWEELHALHKAIAAGSYKAPHLKLLRPSKSALKVLNLEGYDMFLDIYRDRTAAIASF